MLYIDVTRLYHSLRRGRRLTGVDRVSLAYVEEFAPIALAVIRLPKQWLFFSHNESAMIFDRLLQHKQIQLPSRLVRYRYRKKTFGNDYLLNTTHNGLEDPRYLEWLECYQLKSICFLHDLIPIDYPEYCREGSYEQHQQRMLVMSKAQLVICNSKDVFEKFIKYCEQTGLCRPKMIWSHLGVDHLLGDVPSELPPLKSIDKKPFFVMIGTIEGRKNHWFILNVWRDLIEKLGQACPKLVLVGQRGWECEQVFAMLDRSIQLKDYVVEINDCDDEQLLCLIKNARALLFPSNTEGFGLPLMESLLLKVPVLASDIAIFKEIGLGVIELISPIDGKAWQQKILEYAFDNEIRKASIAKIESVYDKISTWEQHFEVVRPTIRSLVDC